MDLADGGAGTRFATSSAAAVQRAQPNLPVLYIDDQCDTIAISPQTVLAHPSGATAAKPMRRDRTTSGAL